MPGTRYPLLINGLPVVSAPAEIDISTAGQLQTVLLEAGSHGHATVVVDMTRTAFCDCSGLNVLVEAHQQAMAEGGELRLVLADGGAAARVLTLTGLDRLIPNFGSLDQALAPRPAATILPVRPPFFPRPRTRAGSFR